MKVLIVKLSSMGDLVQTLPALSDAARAIPDISFDWVVDEAFAEVPGWHPAVDRTIVSAHRRWKRSPSTAWRSGELKAFWQQLRERQYDLVLDAQTSLKSAVVTRMARGLRAGPDRHSVRETGAHLLYQKRFAVARDILAVNRWRQLFAAGLDYPRPQRAPEFGLVDTVWPKPGVTGRPYIVAVTNASWPTKCLADDTWRGLIARAAERGQDVLLPWGAAAEKEKAQALAQGFSNAKVLERMSLTDLAGLLRYSQGAICNDTGLAHIAAALGVPTVTAYGPTDPHLIGATGQHSSHIGVSGFDCAPCYKRQCEYRNYRGPQAQCLQTLSAAQLWQALALQQHRARSQPITVN